MGGFLKVPPSAENFELITCTEANQRDACALLQSKTVAASSKHTLRSLGIGAPLHNAKREEKLENAIPKIPNAPFAPKIHTRGDCWRRSKY